VRGAVENCAAGQVQLIPQEPALRRGGFIHYARCDSNGRYEITAVRPGDYYAFALGGNGVAYAPQGWNDTTLTQASRVTVRAGEATQADLHAIPPPVY
jgi:hypothetical protein